MHELKTYIGAMCHDSEEWYKIWRGIDLLFQNWHEEFDEFWSEIRALKIDAKFEEELTCAFKNNMRNLENFHRLKNIDFVLESKMPELNQNKNSKQPGRSDAVWKVFLK